LNLIILFNKTIVILQRRIKKITTL